MAEGDIIDSEEVDRDTVEPEVLEQQFSKKFNIFTETPVSKKNTYVNKLHGTKSLKIAAGLSDNSIEVFELNNSSFKRVCRLSGHSKQLTEVVFSPKDDNLIYSSGQDGVIKLWDTRTSGFCVQEYKDEDSQVKKQYECMDVSCNGRVLCGGSALAQDDAYLVFWETRSPRPLGGYWSSHTDDITQVKFHKEKSEVLASGSLDGLLNIYNILESSEDDALTYSLNTESCVERLCWLDARRAAAAAPGHDLQLWDADSGDQLASFQRDKISRSIKRSKPDDCYLVDIFPAADGTPVVLAGSYGGNGSVLRSVSLSGKKLQPRARFPGNREPALCCWHDAQSDLLVTAGEAGVLSAWRAETAAAAAAGDAAPGKLASSLHKLNVNRRKPY